MMSSPPNLLSLQITCLMDLEPAQTLMSRMSTYLSESLIMNSYLKALNAQAARSASRSPELQGK